MKAWCNAAIATMRTARRRHTSCARFQVEMRSVTGRLSVRMGHCNYNYRQPLANIRFDLGYSLAWNAGWNYYFPGCFRCHDGQHVSADGKVLSKDCNTCHTVLSQKEGEVTPPSSEGTQFQHPIDLGDLTAVSCNDCHTGGVGP